MQKTKRKGRVFPLFLVLLFVLFFLYILEEISPAIYISNLKTQNLHKLTSPFIKKDIVFGVFADNHKNSLISREDLKNLKRKNLIVFLDKDTPVYFEGKFNDKHIFILKDIKCKSLFSIKKQKEGFLSKIRNLKFLLFYNIDKKTAFYYKYKNIEKYTIFSQFDPVKDICFVGKNEAFIEEKFIKDNQKFTYPDINYQINLIKNIIYTKKDHDLFYKKKSIYLNAINNGHSYVYFYKDPNINFIVKTKDKVYTFGSLIKIDKNPIIYFSVNPRYITAVYINGKLKNYYKGSFSIIPKSAGYYQFVVFDYKYNFLNLFFSFDIAAITNPVFFE